ncbi:MAG: hypothetical protein C4527_08640 [Candidatus Omnitrophota bacterium]|nr:MAG: hypothetical protein C4527_08640 [Candidatus Omnitrophota bacterium]
MNKIAILIFVFILIFSCSSDSANTKIPALEIIQWKGTDLPMSDPYEFGVYAAIYILNFLDTETLEVMGISSIESWSMDYSVFSLSLYILNHFNLLTRINIKTKEGKFEDLSYNELNHVGFKVDISEEQFELQKPLPPAIYVQYMERDRSAIIGDDISMGLRRVIISPAKDKFGGTVDFKYITYIKRKMHNFYTITIWNATTEELIFQFDPQLERKSTMADLGNRSFEVQFSPRGRFFYARGLNAPHAIDSFIPPLLTDMVNVETLEIWDVSKDVAFSSDERFFVTERNGKPTLVDAYRNEELQTYDIGEEEMTAATFAPDDERLYVATSANNIHVFASRLPAAGIDEWELYDALE